MFNPNTLWGKIYRRISRQGLASFLFDMSSFINYPRRGFPRYGIDRFMERISHEVDQGSLLLDAGAGHQPYKTLFEHTAYESCDYRPVLEEINGAIDIPQTFYCDLEKIPRPDNTYNVIICNQVLEHVKKPEKVVCEFFRILKPGGRLFLTTPQCSGIHMPPHNYFNFTSFGLKYLFEQAGFQIVFIEALGGSFWLLGKVMQKSYDSIMGQIRSPFKQLFFPLHVLIRLLFVMVSVVLFHLDKLDKEKGWTLNYGCCCVKPVVQ